MSQFSNEIQLIKENIELLKKNIELVNQNNALEKENKKLTSLINTNNPFIGNQYKVPSNWVVIRNINKL